MSHHLTSVPPSQECWQCQVRQGCLNQCFDKPVSPLSPPTAEQSCLCSHGVDHRGRGRALTSCLSINTLSKRLISFLEPRMTTLPQASCSWVIWRTACRWKIGYKTGIKAKCLSLEERAEAEKSLYLFGRES